MMWLAGASRCSGFSSVGLHAGAFQRLRHATRRHSFVAGATGALREDPTAFDKRTCITRAVIPIGNGIVFSPAETGFILRAIARNARISTKLRQRCRRLGGRRRLGMSDARSVVQSDRAARRLIGLLLPESGARTDD